MDIIAIILAIGVMVIGIAGSFLPVLPGIPIIFLALLVYGWYEGFNVISVHYIAIIGALALLSVLIDYIAGIWGAQKAGSSKVGMLGAGLGIIVCIFFGPIGILVGPWVGNRSGNTCFCAISTGRYRGFSSVIVFAGIAFGFSREPGC